MTTAKVFVHIICPCCKYEATYTLSFLGEGSVNAECCMCGYNFMKLTNTKYKGNPILEKGEKVCKGDSNGND